MKCSSCESNEIFYVREYEGVSFCRECFQDNFENRVRKTIAKYKMFSVDDHIAIALSGGKDSLTLLRVLHKIESKFPRSSMTAIIVDEGIDLYRNEAIQIALDECVQFGIDSKVISFRELYGCTLDELVTEKKILFPCSYCGVLRRKAINRAARDVNANKIATAHNLDDEIQTFILNIFHGDVPRIARSEPFLRDQTCMFLPRVKPLTESPEKEVVLYAFTTGIDFQTYPCPYAPTALRNDIRAMLNRLEKKHTGTKFTIYRSAERIQKFIKNSISELQLLKCSVCGEPAASNICEACKLLK